VVVVEEEVAVVDVLVGIVLAAAESVRTVVAAVVEEEGIEGVDLATDDTSLHPHSRWAV